MKKVFYKIISFLKRKISNNAIYILVFKRLKNLFLKGNNKSISTYHYWENRYKYGGNSGDGSYGKLAIFKADIINNFVFKNNIKTIIEFGCGDGNQLSLSKYPSYIGFDISPYIIEFCKKRFKKDNSKKFFLLNDYKNQKAELTLSLDVIYHLIEENTYEEYMQKLFESSRKFVIIYSSNYEDEDVLEHVKHHKFTEWVKNLNNWNLIKKISNKYPLAGISQYKSCADFYIFKKS